MKRELRITGDGSHTLYVPELDEPYHSIHGALRESRHVFIKQGLGLVKKTSIRILEIGFGTGLNALLTLSETGRSGIRAYYHAVEKYPLQDEEYRQINYEQFIEGIPPGSLAGLHTAPWGKQVPVSDHFILFKEHSDFREMDPDGSFDLVYFDAFAPGKQPYLWSEEIFCRIYRLMNPEGILVSYTVRGSVRRALASCGFDVEKVPGPPGKREMVRAFRR